MAKTVNCLPVSNLFFLPLVIDTPTPAQGILAYGHPAEDYIPFPMSSGVWTHDRDVWKCGVLLLDTVFKEADCPALFLWPSHELAQNVVSEPALTMQMTAMLEGLVGYQTEGIESPGWLPGTDFYLTAHLPLDY